MGSLVVASQTWPKARTCTDDLCGFDIELVHPCLDGSFVPICIATGHFECDVAPLSPDGPRDGCGRLEALDECPTVVVD